MVTTLINDVATDPIEFILVLDDYHVIESQSIYQALAFLLDYQPPEMHLVIASRADPPLPLARLRARGQITELRESDLRFSIEEATTFLNEVLSLKLSAEAVATLEGRTEGWIAGLQLAGLSLQRQDDFASFIDAFAGDDQYIVDYLVEEVLKQQPEEMQDFLLQTSILNRLCGPLCDAVCAVGTASSSKGPAMLGEGALSPPLFSRPSAPRLESTPLPNSSQEILESLDRAHLFIVPLDNKRQWYRYHQLFAELLQNRLHRTRPELILTLHQRASIWYEGNGWASEAINHALSAADYDRAATLIGQNTRGMLKRGQATTLWRWLNRLPSEIVRADPHLGVASAWARLLTGPVEGFEAVLEEAEQAVVDLPPEAATDRQKLLAVSSIAVGVFAIGATFGMADQISPTMDAAHEASVPAHITLVTDGLDLETATRLKKIRGVAEIDLANAIPVRYKVKPEDDWASGELFMRDYESPSRDGAQSLGLYQLKAGEWPERKRLSIERLSSQYFNLDIGDSVILEIDDKARSLPLTGRVRHPFVNPPEFGGPAVFFGSADVMELFEVPKGGFNQLLVQVAPYSDSFAREIASEIKNRLAKEGIGVGLTIYQSPAEHPGRSLIEGINLVLQLLAVVSLGASVVLVLNTLTALITQQTDQIGMIKAIGGRTGVIVKIYLAAVMVYGSLSLVIALPLGAWLAFILSQWFLNIFNIEYQAFQVSSQAIVLQTVAAIGVPLLAALWPVLTGAALTVREAIASYGLGGDFGSTRLDRTIERGAQRLLRTPYAIAVGNLFRRKGRLLLTQLVLVLAGTMFLTVMSLSASVSATLDKDFAQRRYDATIFFKEDERIDRTVSLAESLAGVERAEVWYSHSASILKAGQRTREAGFGTQVIGIPAGSDLFQPLMVGGRWLRLNDQQTVVINIDAAEDNDIRLGEVIALDFGELGDSEWQVVGFFKNLDADSFGTDPLYANQEAVFRATKKYNRGNQLYVQTQDDRKTSVEAVLSQLEDI